MKRRILSLLVALCLIAALLPMSVLAASYTDTDGHWAEKSIDRWSAAGIVQGTGDAFAPDSDLTCAQLATILAKLLRLPAADDAGFSDNLADAWYYDAINRCAAAGILNGYADGTVRPNETISRARAMVMLARALGIEPAGTSVLNGYADAANVPDWARGYVAALLRADIVSGVSGSRLAALANITRAQFVTILDRAIAIYADEDGATVKADDVDGIIVVVAEDVQIKNAPAGTKVVAAASAKSLKVNGKSVDANDIHIVPETAERPKSVGHAHTHEYKYTDNGDGTHTGVCTANDSTLDPEAHTIVDGKCTLCGAEQTTDAVASVLGEDGTYTYYDSLVKALDAAAAGGTVKLAANATLTSTVTVDKDLVLDLGGHTLAGDRCRALHVTAGSVELTGAGTVTSTDIAVDSSVIRVGDNNGEERDVTLTIGKDVTVEAPDSYGVGAFGTTTNETLTIYGTVISAAETNASYDGCAVTTLGTDTATPATIIIKDGAEITATHTNAIYLPAGTLNVEGGMVTGTTGIYFKSTNMSISGGTITGNGEQHDYEEYHNGGISTGEAVTIDSCNYPGGIGSVAISGGTFTSVNAAAVGSYNSNGGVRQTGFITDGTYSSDPSDLLAEGYSAEAGQGMYTIVTPAAEAGGVKYATLAAAINAADSGETVTLLRDATGSGISTPDHGESRESLTIDFGGHTYTVENPGVGSKGTETQAMHWGSTLGKITLKNGTLNVAQGATDVAMAMQNYIDLDAEDMVFDFTNITVAHYAEDEFHTGSKWAKYNGKECPMFNNNDADTELKLTRCTVTLPDDSALGGNISGTLTLVDSTFDGYLCFNDIDGKICVDSGSSIKGGQVRSYFEGELNIVCNDGVWTATTATSEV